jgi:hypothetical protein
LHLSYFQKKEKAGAESGYRLAGSSALWVGGLVAFCKFSGSEAFNEVVKIGCQHVVAASNLHAADIPLFAPPIPSHLVHANAFKKSFKG